MMPKIRMMLTISYRCNRIVERCCNTSDDDSGLFCINTGNLFGDLEFALMGVVGSAASGPVLVSI